MTRDLQVLDVSLRVESDQPPLIEPFLGVFSAFLASPDRPATAPGTAARAAAPSQVVRIRVDGASGVYEDGRRRLLLAPEPIRRAHVYNLLYTTLVRSVGRHYLLHAAALARGGRAWLVSGPSGSGKTTMGQALARRGFTLMTDDLAPLSVDSGHIHPFPRRLGVDRGHGRASLDYVRLGDKDFVTAEALGLAAGGPPIPPAGVVLMSPYDGSGGGDTRLRIGVLPGAEDLADRLAALDEVDVGLSSAAGGVSLITARLGPGADMAAVSRELERADDGILFHGRDPGGRRRWAESPELREIPVREAAVELLRDTLNRDPGGALMSRLGGSAAGALVELAGLLAGVRCWRLRPAGKEATLEALARLFSRMPAA